MKQFFLIVLTNFCICFSVCADDQVSKLNANEVNSIRVVSQALLKVRGQDRKKIEQDLKPIRDDLNEMQKVLKQGIVEFDPPAMIKSTSVTAADSQKSLNLKSFWDSLVSLWQTQKLTDAQLAVEKRNLKVTDSIVAARKIVSDRRSKIDDQLPSFWRFWETSDVNQKRSQQALISLEGRLKALESESPETKDKKIKDLIGQIEESASAEQHQQEPTITSITKHVSEQVK